MSDAFFCDRCGRAFPWAEKKRIYSKGFKFKGCGLGIDENGKDLCKYCVEDIKKFMNAFKDGEKGEDENV